jgi:hypothetical protein
LAETGWFPAASAAVVWVATPALRVTGVPELAPSITNCTVPVGVPLPEVTVAVNVTDWPNTDGFTDEATAVAVLPALTFCPPASDPALALKLVPVGV